MNKKIRFLCLLLFLMTSTSAFAELADRLSELTGYTIDGSKTIAGWYDADGNKGDSFEGCDYGKVIVFSDNTTLTCSSYGYQYAYMPTAVILYNGYQIKMIVDDDIYDMNR